MRITSKHKSEKVAAGGDSRTTPVAPEWLPSNVAVAIKSVALCESWAVILHTMLPAYPTCNENGWPYMTQAHVLPPLVYGSPS